MRRVRGVTSRAKTLDEDQLERLIAFAMQRSRVPASDRMKILLSFRAGLRACEIARIKVKDLLDGEGRPARVITVHAAISKSCRTRTIPMHSTIREALIEFQKRHPTATYVAISSRQKRRKSASMSANAITQWFWNLYRDAGFEGASSHSGRRTFATALAKHCGRTGHTLCDVQLLLGHARLETTAGYIDHSDNIYRMMEGVFG